MKRRRSRDRSKNNVLEIITAIMAVLMLLGFIASIGSFLKRRTETDIPITDVPTMDDPAIDIPEEEKPSEPEEKPDIDITDDSESEVTTGKIPFVWAST